eukprot:gnl/MRDRNA2_/MRDRNA2_88900_c0_seq1.p1 gnl/MRDRNA2_/MRDRNA2_88900_c0~~gnl/MRDRNA2_/MRDRNA2_88900_c0_seq1.p1  ORF type:complete len:314 (-),score=40.17 gnl/MRDRNA2_/MRDRNA2_88900_c0_seq1:119-1060(-)
MQVDEFCKVSKKVESAGLTIRDIMSSFPQSKLDPFLLWHELPRTFYGPGEFPGAPIHPHRGFYECPYIKEMTADSGTNTAKALIRSGGEAKKYELEPGSFELGRIGAGVEHEMVVDRRWSGFLHSFQLWVNLPSKQKFCSPNFQAAEPFALPIMEFGDDARARLLHGQVAERKAPTKCEAVDWQYLDFELAPGASISHEAPANMKSRMAFVYQGAGTFCGEHMDQGTFMLFKGSGALEVVAERKGCGFLWLAGQPIGEAVVHHGPFVMSSRQQIQQCFEEYQQGKIAPKPLAFVRYGPSYGHEPTSPSSTYYG